MEDEDNREPEVENVDVTTYNLKEGETPDKILPKIIRKQPDAYVVRDLTNVETLKILCGLVTDDQKMVVSSIGSKEAVEALIRVLMMKIPAKDFAPAVIGVLNQRLIRKLCEACKEPFEPQPKLLQALGIPAGKVPVLYREKQYPAPDSGEEVEICQECGGIGYKGRMALFELLKVNDQLREALIKQPKLEVLQKVAKASGHHSLKDEGVLLVVQGVTSVTELQRILKLGAK